MNAIKDEGFKKTGFDIGLLGGYRFSRNFSLESGMLFAKKYYWTSGKNFDMSGMGSSMPAGMDMLEVHGSSQIIEIPLHVRYDLAHKKAHRFYSLAGFSSYILTEEQKAVLMTKLANKLTIDGTLQVIVQEERSQLGNKEIALRKFYEILNKAFVVKKKRRPTKPSRSSKEKRIAGKKRNADIKKLRKKDW